MSNLISIHPDIKKEKNSIQEKIFQAIVKFPGIRYRELMRVTGCSNGVLTYHLNKLENSGRLRINRVNKRVTRYYHRQISDSESQILGVLRQKTTRNIFLYILDNGPCNFNSLLTSVNKVQSTVSWHLNRLKEINLIKTKKQEDFNIYEIAMDKSYLEDLLFKYKETLLQDYMVENYLEMMDEF